MERVLQLARRLGSAIADTDPFKALAPARQQMADDEPAQQLLDAFMKQQHKIDDLMRQNKPVEVEDKGRLSELQQQVTSHEGIKQLLKAQADYTELMHKVNQAIQAGLSGASSADASSDASSDGTQPL